VSDALFTDFDIAFPALLAAGLISFLYTLELFSEALWAVAFVVSTVLVNIGFAVATAAVVATQVFCHVGTITSSFVFFANSVLFVHVFSQETLARRFTFFMLSLSLMLFTFVVVECTTAAVLALMLLIFSLSFISDTLP
jgi:hypothetical protein